MNKYTIYLRGRDDPITLQAQGYSEDGEFLRFLVGDTVVARVTRADVVLILFPKTETPALT